MIGNSPLEVAKALILTMHLVHAGYVLNKRSDLTLTQDLEYWGADS